MPSKAKFQFEDLGQSSEAFMTIKEEKRGFYVSYGAAVIFVLLSLVIAVAVGLIVHFLHPGNVKNGDVPTLAPMPTPSHQVTWEMCVNMSISRNECLPCPPVPPTTPVPTPAPPPSGYRLPDTLIPYHYDIELKPDIYKTNESEFSFNGSVVIFLKCEKPTATIYVHFRKMVILDTSVLIRNTDTNTDIPHASRSIDEDREFYKIHLRSNLTQGTMLSVSMMFYGPLKNDEVGMYWSSYSSGTETRYLVATQFEATDARKAFPCLDEPSLKATFNVTLLRKAGKFSLANMPNYTTEHRGDGWFADKFLKTSVVMPTYLNAFVVCDYEYKDNTSSKNRYMRYWARPNAIHQIDYSVSIGAPMFDFYEDYFIEPYRLPKQDMIAIPDFGAGAMENWGLITYRESRLLIDPNYSTTYNKQRLSTTIAHELLHMWLGNVVTCAWWDDLWLHEGMARYYQNLAVEIVQPDWAWEKLFIAQVVHRVLHGDGTGASRPVNNPVTVPREIDNMFSSITYDKGGSIIRMMMYFLGPDTVKKGMQAFVQRHAYGNAKYDDLFDALQEAAVNDSVSLPKSVHDIMHTWIRQMGYPVVTVTRDSGQARATITQHMYLEDPKRPIREQYPSPFGYKWEIPVTYISKQNIDWTNPTYVWLEKNNKTVTTSIPTNTQDWVLANVKLAGFYRVNYDTDNWLALIDQLNTNHSVFDAMNRAQILDDAFSLSRAGYMDQVLAFKTTEYLSSEGEYIAWYAAEYGLRYIDGMLSTSPQYGDFTKYVRNLLQRNYDLLGWDEKTGTENIHTKYLRIKVLAAMCDYGHEPCMEEALTRFRQWMQTNDTYRPRPDIRDSLYCHALRRGTDAEWNFAFERYKNEENDYESDRLRDALGCSRQPWILSKLLQLALDSDDIDSSDRASLIASVARNPVGRGQALDFLRENWDNINGRSSILSVISGKLSTEFDLNEVDAFLSNKPTSTTFDDVLANIRANIRWRQNNEKSVLSWISEAVKRQN